MTEEEYKQLKVGDKVYKVWVDGDDPTDIEVETYEVFERNVFTESDLKVKVVGGPNDGLIELRSAEGVYLSIKAAVEDEIHHNKARISSNEDNIGYYVNESIRMNRENDALEQFKKTLL